MEINVIDQHPGIQPMDIFRTIYAEIPRVLVVNESWTMRGGDNFGAVIGANLGLRPGELGKFQDAFSRDVIAMGSPIGNIVVFQRHAGGENGILGVGLPADLKFGPLSTPLSVEALMDIFGITEDKSKILPNLGELLATPTFYAGVRLASRDKHWSFPDKVSPVAPPPPVMRPPPAPVTTTIEPAVAAEPVVPESYTVLAVPSAPVAVPSVTFSEFTDTLHAAGTNGLSAVNDFLDSILTAQSEEKLKKLEEELAVAKGQVPVAA